MEIMMTKFTVYNLFHAHKQLGQEVGGGIAVCKSTRFFKNQIIITVSASVSEKGFDIELIDFVIQHLGADI
jgi:hypothetical protein